MPSVVITTGGTGGHIFPAEALAKELLEMDYRVTFVGGGLHTNRYFHRHDFPYRDVIAPPFSLLKLIPFGIGATRGILQSRTVLAELQANLVIGFGSFYTATTLAAAKLLHIPILLFEPNAFPGKVSRLFSRWAELSAVQFDAAAKHLKGPTQRVAMPLPKLERVPMVQARDYFYLRPDLFTFLVFGGSQGARAISDLFFEAARRLPALFQVIHITGDALVASEFQRKYKEAGITACVKAFEERMDLAWSSATAAICRAGGATLAEVRRFKVPAVVIPFPEAADDHQTKNAQHAQGVLTCAEKALTRERLSMLLQQLLSETTRAQLQAAMQTVEEKPLSTVVQEILCSIS